MLSKCNFQYTLLCHSDKEENLHPLIHFLPKNHFKREAKSERGSVPTIQLFLRLSQTMEFQGQPLFVSLCG